MAYQCRRIEGKRYGPQDRLRTFVGVFPEPAEPEQGPRTLGEILRPGPHQAEMEIEQFEIKPQGGRASCRVGNHSVRLLSPNMASPTVLGALSRGSRQRRSFMIRTADGRLRILSWQEAALLQGFPEDYLFAGGLGRTEKMIGQAIPVPVGRAILKGIVAEAERAQARAGRAAHG